MKNQRRTPWSIEWAAALFLGVAAMATIVKLASAPMTGATFSWTSCVVLWIIFGGITFAVMKGQNWVRWLLGGVATLVVVSALLPQAYLVRTTPIGWDYVMRAALAVATALCFLPASSRHFRDKKPNHSPEPTSGSR